MAIEISNGNRSTYEQNKREMFDGMRAYHVSEQQHKRDAINFMKTILSVSVAVYGVILGSFFTPGLRVDHTNFLAGLVSLATGLVTFLVANSTNKKIEADHKVYKVFGAEYTGLCRILQLDQKVNVNGKLTKAKIIDNDNPIGEGNGYEKTMDIINKNRVVYIYNIYDVSPSRDIFGQCVN